MASFLHCDNTRESIDRFIDGSANKIHSDILLQQRNITHKIELHSVVVIVTKKRHYID